MPYMRVGKVVMVKKGGKWRNLKTHPTAAKAKAQLAALNINVKHK